MAAREEPAAERSGTDFGALDPSGAAAAAQKENVGRRRGHLLLVHVAHHAAGGERGGDFHVQRLNPALRVSWYKSDTWDFKPSCSSQV